MSDAPAQILQKTRRPSDSVCWFVLDQNAGKCVTACDRNPRRRGMKLTLMLRDATCPDCKVFIAALDKACQRTAVPA